MRSKIPEKKILTKQLENIRKIKHHLNTLKDTSMALVHNRENSTLQTLQTEHPTKCINHKTETTEMEQLNSTTVNVITEETTAESLIIRLIKRSECCN